MRYNVTLSHDQYINYIETHLPHLNQTNLQKIRNRVNGSALLTLPGVTNVKINNKTFGEHATIIVSFDDEKRYNWFILQI